MLSWPGMSLWIAHLRQQVLGLIAKWIDFRHLAWRRIHQEHHLGILNAEFPRSHCRVHHIVLVQIENLLGKPIFGNVWIASYRTSDVDWLDAG
jgi:hypothetical protein